MYDRGEGLPAGRKRSWLNTCPVVGYTQRKRLYLVVTLHPSSPRHISSLDSFDHCNCNSRDLHQLRLQLFGRSLKHGLCYFAHFFYKYGKRGRWTIH
jgi:hypothetical protein